MFAPSSFQSYCSHEWGSLCGWRHVSMRFQFCLIFVFQLCLLALCSVLVLLDCGRAWAWEKIQLSVTDTISLTVVISSFLILKINCIESQKRVSLLLDRQCRNGADRTTIITIKLIIHLFFVDFLGPKLLEFVFCLCLYLPRVSLPVYADLHNTLHEALPLFSKMIIASL